VNLVSLFTSKFIEMFLTWKAYYDDDDDNDDDDDPQALKRITRVTRASGKEKMKEDVNGTENGE